MISSAKIKTGIKFFGSRNESFSAISFAVGKRKTTVQNYKKLLEKTLSNAKAENRKLDIYIHIPVCRRRCGYCFYGSSVAGDKAPSVAQKMAVLAEKEASLYIKEFPLLKKIPLRSFYVGGGTPTLLLMDDIIPESLRPFSLKGAEFTMEGRPEDWKHKEVVKRAKNIGVNRASVGVQSLNSEYINILQRHQTSSDAVGAIKQLSGQIKTVNVDLIYGIPGGNKFKSQTVDDLLLDIKQVIEAGANSLTLYRLRISARETEQKQSYLGKLLEDNTQTFPSPQTIYEMQRDARTFLLSNGFSEGPIGWFTRGISFPAFLDGRWNKNDPHLGFGLGAYAHGDYPGWFRRNYGLDKEDQYRTTLSSSELPIDVATVFSPEESIVRKFIFQLKAQMRTSTTFIQGIPDVWRVVESCVKAGFLSINGEVAQLTGIGVLFSEEVFAQIWDSLIIVQMI